MISLDEYGYSGGVGGGGAYNFFRVVINGAVQTDNSNR